MDFELMEARKVHITKVSKECIRVVFIQRNRPSSSKSKEPEVLGSVQLPPKWNELRVLNTIPEETVELIVDPAAKFHFPKAEIATKASTPKLPEEVHSGNEEEKPDDPPMLSRGQQKRVSKEPPKKRRKLIASRPITRLYESTDESEGSDTILNNVTPVRRSGSKMPLEVKQFIEKWSKAFPNEVFDGSDSLPKEEA